MACFLWAPKPAMGTITLYTMVGSGITFRDAFAGDPPYHAGFLSPVFEGGLRTRSRDLAGFHVRFLLDPADTSHISSYYISGKRIFYILPDLLYVGFSAGIHVERNYARERGENESAIIGSDEAYGLIGTAVHGGLTLEILDQYYLVIDCLAGQSIGRYYPWTINIWGGILSFF